MKISLKQNGKETKHLSVEILSYLWRPAKKIIVFSFCLILSFNLLAQTIRTDISLNNNWLSIANDSNQHAYEGFEKNNDNKDWIQVNVPHNWDAYEGYRRLLHGNRHGYAWYKTAFKVKRQKGKKYFLFFEGVGSYATVWLNGKQVGYHAGGRTSFNIDITEHLLNKNVLAVRADHPSFIKDLPWVCGGCSDERGFSEGSQPMGIFRPVHLITTNEIRVEPFGIHAWNDTNVSKKSAVVSVATTIKNYSKQSRLIEFCHSLVDAKGKIVTSETRQRKLKPNETLDLTAKFSLNKNVRLWSLEDPYLYKVVFELKENGKLLDRDATSYGIRSISWPIGKAPSSNQFLLNGKPVFINGIAEYEHLLGNSHAFSDEQIRSRVKMISSAGFNAFRDGHQPHNLRYQKYWDSLGVLWWTQLSAHVWYDSKEFRENFKTLLKEWVIERRNSPSVVLWGLQNESKLPAGFAKECTDLIRSLDPTTPSQRLVTTCNGGEGTDWDVPQNWTGTYGGDPQTYSSDLKKQILVGEYGAWRTLDLHTEGGFKQNGPLSEDRMTELMETKIRLAEAAKDSAAGHFFWLLTSHDNPGRVQGGEGFRELDRIGPVNYKGLFTPWEEPTDAYYMFRSNYADEKKDPMIYIVSHTWPDRWTQPGIKDGIIVYSNCEEVELFNDVNNISLGKQKRNGIGTHFQWDKVNIRYNVLYAVGYVNGKAVARDTIMLHHLPKVPNFNKLYTTDQLITKPQPGYNYIYRVNCGGPDYFDQNKKLWHADKDLKVDERQHNNWGSTSWANSFFASQRRTNAAVAGTNDWPLFQTFRYGLDRLKYEFSLPDGNYMVELYFSEPWLGTGSMIDCSKMRSFDVAFNNEVAIKDLDIWHEAGVNRALKKMIRVTVKGGKLILSFPNVAAGQAIISAIAIASINKISMPADEVPIYINELKLNLALTNKVTVQHWLDNGDQQYQNSTVAFSSLPPVLFGADWIKFPEHLSANDLTGINFTNLEPADVFIAFNKLSQKPSWLHDYEDTKTTLANNARKEFNVYRKRFAKAELVKLGSNGAESNQMYTVMVLPISDLQPAYDLKPISNYKAANMQLNDGLLRTVVNEKDAITFKADGASINFNIQTGVADIYSLTFRYANTTVKDLSAKMELVMADGTLIKTEQLTFTQSKPGKWNYATTNAGNYVIRLTGEKGISLTGVDVQ